MTKKSDRSEYGFQPAIDVPAAKAKLQAIIALSKAERTVTLSKEEELARLREVWAEGKAEFDRQEAEYRRLNAEREAKPPADEESPVVVEAAPVEPAPDYSDGTWLKVRVPEVTGYRDNGDAETGHVWTVTTGRYISTWRKRTPADGDAPVVYEAPKIPAPKPPERMAPHVWFSGDNDKRGTYATVEQNRARQAREEASRPKGSYTRGSLVR